MFIARGLLAIGAMLILIGSGVAIYGLFQHPGATTPTATTILIPDSPSSPAAGAQPSQPPKPEECRTADDGQAIICTSPEAGEVEGGGPFGDATKATLALLPNAQKWLAFVATGILLITLGLVFLTSAGILTLFTAVINLKNPTPGPTPATT